MQLQNKVYRFRRFLFPGSHANAGVGAKNAVKKRWKRLWVIGGGYPSPHETLYLSGGKHIFHDDSRVSLSTDPTFLGLGCVWKVYRGTIVPSGNILWME